VSRKETSQAALFGGGLAWLLPKSELPIGQGGSSVQWSPIGDPSCASGHVLGGTAWGHPDAKRGFAHVS